MLPSEKERLLIGNMIEGNHEAFEELYFTYVKAIRANISKIIKEPGDIDDLVQEVFVALWQNRERLDSEKGVADWLYMVSFNKSLKFLKKKLSLEIPYPSNFDLTLLSDEIPSDDLLESKLPLIREAIEKLPERKKLAFRHYKLEGNSLDEVAAKMGITKEAVKGYLKDARHFILAYVHENERSYPMVLLLLACFLR
jgi:RNA polymerase sigma-70 factor (ECF subfamily)